MNKTHVSNSGSYIDSPRWINNKKVTIDANSKDDNSFQYVIAVALNHGQIKTTPQRIRSAPLQVSISGKTQPFLNTQNWKKFETNNKSIALNTLFVPHKKKEIRRVYILK